VQDEADEADDGIGEVPQLEASPRRPIMPRRRRFSTFESTDGGMDLESTKIGGSARSL